MSNYPPGVTGNEWAIAGAPERVISVDCDHYEDGTEEECNFSGDVDAIALDMEEWEFTCPECGTVGVWTISLDPEDGRW